jgi:PAS domain S-box-containing protein
MTTPIVVQRLSEVSPAPIFGVLAYNLSYGIAGGSLVDFERAGARAGRLTLDILSGAIPPEDITGVLDVPPEPMFDWRQLRHWNLDEEALPEGSIVINRETTLWGFKYHMIGVLAFVLAQFVLIGRLWKQTRRRRLVEETLSDRLVFETLLSNISARFVNLPAEEVDREIQQTQRRMCEHLEIDRATLWLISEEDPGNMLLTQIYQPLQIPAPPSLLSANKAFPWCVNRLLRGETVILSKMADLPPEAWRDRESFFTYQTTSVVSVPLSTGKGPVFGCVTFAVTGAERDWTGTTVRGFELIAQVFSNALARKQFETALVESEARLNLATNAAKAGLWVLKIDNRQVWVSPKSRDLFRFAPDEAVDYERYFQVIYPDDRDRVHKAVQKTLDSGVDLKCDFRIVLPDGGIQWIASQGQRHPREKPVCLMGVSFDITERKEVELKFDERLRFEQLFSDMVGRLATVSSADTKSEILRALQETLEFFEFDRIGLVVLSSDRASWESSLAVCAERIEQISLQTNLREALTPWIYDKIFEKRETVSISSLKDLPQEADRDSETLGKWSIQSALFVPVGIGNTVGCVSVTADRRRPAWSDELIARLRLIGNTLSGALARDKAEAEARQHMEEIARMARIATIGELTASLAHEINQPLAAIRSNTEAAVRFLSRAVPDIDEVRQILEDILRDDRRASGVVQKVRNLVKGERSVHALLDLNQLIRDVVGLVKADSLLYGLSITEKLSPDVKPVRGDEAQLEQVLLNLILNSAAAMENAPLNQRRVILGTAMSNNGTARVFVTDFGAGIDENNIARLFDAFYTTKAEGLGLGLSISQRIITEHGGDLTASNNPQGGATFAFTLPIHQGDAP